MCLVLLFLPLSSSDVFCSSYEYNVHEQIHMLYDVDFCLHEYVMTTLKAVKSLHTFHNK